MRWFTPATALLLAWGALAFGAEYAWAYAPLLVFATTIGLLALVTPAPAGRGSTPVAAGGGSTPLAAALALVFCAGVLQVVPLPEPVLRAVSPARSAHDFAALYASATPAAPATPAASVSDAAPAADAASSHQPRTLSIAPSRTRLGLAFLAGLSIFFLGCVRALSVVRPSGLARVLVVLGVVVAVAGIVQEAGGSLRVYGFWYPRKAWQPSAPFVNENHLAGWLVLALSLSAGYLCGAAARAGWRPPADWRGLVVRLASRDANEIALVGFAVLVMALAILVTGSVSGMVCLGAVSWVSAARALRRQPGRGRRVLLPAALALVPLAAAALAGLAAVGEETAQTLSTALSPDGRIGLWEDTLRMVRDFPLAGVGLNTYGVGMLAYQTHGTEAYAVEAHNDYLQLAAEGGLLLGLPLAAAVVVFAREVRRRFREGADDTRTWWLRAGAVTGLGGLALQSLVDFSLQMPGNAVLFALLMAVAVHRPARRAPRTASHAIPVVPGRRRPHRPGMPSPGAGPARPRAEAGRRCSEYRGTTQSTRPLPPSCPSIALAGAGRGPEVAAAASIPEPAGRAARADSSAARSRRRR